jgi:S-adenosylmethionine:tRNA ribosyltransferase-isomerase
VSAALAASRAPSIRAAAGPRPGTPRLVVVDDPVRLTTMDELPSLLRSGDLLVVNDAATLPASLSGDAHGEPVELRLLRRRGRSWDAVLFGDGTWRDRTEDRAAPPPVRRGDVLRLGPLAATVAGVHRRWPRLLRVRFHEHGPRFWAALYAHGRPVQYSYLRSDLELADVQTPFAGRPWAVEPPSAAFPLRHGLLASLHRRGIGVARLTHGAGLSATGDDDLDHHLPLAEPYDLPAATVRALERARKAGDRVIAAGTTVVRALESAARQGLLPGRGEARLRLGPHTRPQVVDVLLSGVHEPGASSHFELLRAFASDARLAAAVDLARREGLYAHEFGDAMFVSRG